MSSDVLPELIITPDHAPVIGGNFEDVEMVLRAVAARYADVDFTKSKRADVERVKKEMQVYRTRIEAIEKKIKSDYFNTPKKVFEGMLSSLYARIAEVETPVDLVLKKYDQQRLDIVNDSIDGYIASFQETFKLSDESLARIERPKKYYLKSATESETEADIECQMKALAKEEADYASAVKVIESACKKEARLPKADMIRRLDNGVSIAQIMQFISEETERFEALDNAPPPEPPKIEVKMIQPAQVISEVSTHEEDPELQQEQIIIGTVTSLDWESDFKGKKKVINVQHEYPVDLADTMTAVFKILKGYGVKTKLLPPANY